MPTSVAPGLAAALVVFALVTQHAAAQLTWHYDESGADWTGTCATGQKQSPVVLSQVSVDNTLQPLSFSSWGTSTTFKLLNNGHTIQLQEFSSTSYFTDPNSGVQYQLVQFHFHSPSEHVWGSGIVDLEVHLVHVRVGGTTANGDDILVIGIGLTSSEFGVNVFLNSFWTDLAAVANTTTTVAVQKTLVMQTALPEGKNYVTYTGSLTTPPCTEGVHWYLMESPVSLSQKQVEYIRQALNLNQAPTNTFQFAGNRRLPQPLNGRTLRGYSGAATAPTTIVQEVASSVLATVVLLIVALVLCVVVYTMRGQLEIPFYGKLFPNAAKGVEANRPGTTTDAHGGSELVPTATPTSGGGANFDSHA